MRVHLPGVNVLIALHDPSHEAHEAAHRWFHGEGSRGWATCPVTENGFARILAQPAYPTWVSSLSEALSYLQATVKAHAATHHFWSDDVSLLDSTLFRLTILQGHRQVTDTYLLGLCQRRGGSLVTLDRSVSENSIVGPDPGLIRVLTQQALVPIVEPGLVAL